MKLHSEPHPELDGLALERIDRGDQQAMADLYDRHAGIVYSMAMRILQNSAQAEQVLSDIFIEIWQNPHRFLAVKDSFCVSIAMMARNRAVALLLHRPAGELSLAFSPGRMGFDATQLINPALWNMTREEASAAIDQLPAERRAALEHILFQSTADSSTDEPGPGSEAPAETPPTVSETVMRLAGNGLEVIDITGDASFARRKLHARDVVQHIEGMNRLARVFAETPERVLEELVQAAVELCGADSAGISIQHPEYAEDHYYHWAATAGQYSGFVDAKLPRYPSACGVTIERGRPQLFRVSQRFFDLMGVQAPTVTDGLLLPWQAEDASGVTTRGTIWIMAHGREEAFDGEDCRLMQALASFAATGVRMMGQQALLVEQVKAAAETATALRIARQIDGPLQGLMQTVALLGRDSQDSSLFAQQALGDIARVSEVVHRNASLPN